MSLYFMKSFDFYKKREFLAILSLFLSRKIGEDMLEEENPPSNYIKQKY